MRRPMTIGRGLVLFLCTVSALTAAARPARGQQATSSVSSTASPAAPAAQPPVTAAQPPFPNRLNTVLPSWLRMRGEFRERVEGFDGLAGDIPGPTSHAGRKSGVVADKSGLNVPYLGMLIAHEVGHYLGLVHVSEAGNLMLFSSGTTDTNLNYDPQYRAIIRHGWVRID